jgi:hypothetical protein
VTISKFPGHSVMAKEIRFGLLVKSSGRPETLTLWGNPKDNPALSKAVKENRVMTITQKPAGHGKDSGQIGFQQQPAALYLLFPKRLRADVGSRVIGIKYDLIEEASVPSSQSIKPKTVVKKSGAHETKPPPPPKDFQFEIVVRRTATVDVTLLITAKNRKEAEAQAVQEIETKPFEVPVTDVQNRIHSSKGKEARN